MKFAKFKSGRTLSLANALFLDAPLLAHEIKKGEYRYISCMEDEILGALNLTRCEIGSVSYVLALLCKFSGAKGEFFDELDEGYLSGECNVGEEEFEELASWLKGVQNLVIDSSFFTHPDAKMIFELLQLLNLNVVLANGTADGFETNGKLDELKQLENFDGSVLYLYHANENLGRIFGGVQFGIVSKLKDGDEAEFSAPNFNLKAKFSLNSSIKGTVGLAAVERVLGYNFKLVRVAKL